MIFIRTRLIFNIKDYKYVLINCLGNVVFKVSQLKCDTVYLIRMTAVLLIML